MHHSEEGIWSTRLVINVNFPDSPVGQTTLYGGGPPQSGLQDQYHIHSEHERARLCFVSFGQ